MQDPPINPRMSAVVCAAIGAALTLVVVGDGVAAAGPPLSVAAAEEPHGFWSGLAHTARRVRLRCRTSNFGRFLTNAARPLTKLTGGLIPTPDDNHFAAAVELHATKPIGTAPGAAPKPPPPPPPGVAAAADIKAEKQQAEIRREAVAYLAGLDCRYYPEAEAALIASLRADRDVCVRLEAAKSLAAGCCCTKATHKALTICVTGSEEDGNPAERSPAVRRMALHALQRCECSTCNLESASPGTPPEAPLGVDEAADDGVRPVSHEATVAEAPPRNRKGDESPMNLLEIWRSASLTR